MSAARTRHSTRRFLLSVLFVAVQPMLWAGCDGRTTPTEVGPACGPYPDQATSPYVLPYPVGDTHSVWQGNCGLTSHLPESVYRYAYDFYMEVGSGVVAAASGTVFRVVESFPNSTETAAEENYIMLLHDDGRWSHYSHLDQNGALVEVGEVVEQGQLIGRSGFSGTPVKHLHFQVYLSNRMTVPVVFRNTRPHPNGLVQGERYTAEPY